MRNLRKFALTLLLLLVAALPTSDLFARSGRSGSFGGSRSGSSAMRSSGSGSRSSWGSSKPSAAPAKTWGTSKPAAPAPSAPSSSGSKPAWGTSSSSAKPPAAASSTIRGTARPTASAVDQAAAGKVKMAGTVYSNKAEAIAAFKSKAKADPQLQQELAREYPTTFNTQPATRPAYIPERYNGSPVVFNNGGYGYYNGGIWTPLVTYMLLDTLGDVAMMNAMGGHGYPIENYAPPGMAPVAAPMAARHHSVLFYLFWLAVGAFAVIMIGKLLARRMN